MEDRIWRLLESEVFKSGDLAERRLKTRLLMSAGAPP